MKALLFPMNLTRGSVYGIYLKTPIIRNDVKCDYRIAEYLNN